MTIPSLDMQDKYTIVGISEGETKPMKLGGLEGLSGIKITSMSLGADRVSAEAPSKQSGTVEMTVSRDALATYIGHALDPSAVSLLVHTKDGDGHTVEIHIVCVIVQEQSSMDRNMKKMTGDVLSFSIRTNLPRRKPSDMLVEY